MRRPFTLWLTQIPRGKSSIKLIRNSGRVASFCNDVVGDICSVISGSATALIVFRLSERLSFIDTALLWYYTQRDGGISNSWRQGYRKNNCDKQQQLHSIQGKRDIELFTRKKHFGQEAEVELGSTGLRKQP